MNLAEAKANFVRKAEVIDPLARVRRDPWGSLAGAALTGFAMGATSKKTSMIAEVIAQYLKYNLRDSSGSCR